MAPALTTAPGEPGGRQEAPVSRGPRRFGLLRGLVVLIAVALAAHASLRVPAVGRAAAIALMNRLVGVPRASTTVREVSGDWLTRLELRGVRVQRGDTLLASVDTIHAGLRPLALFTGWIDVETIGVGGALLHGEALSGSEPRAPGQALSGADLLHGRFYRGPRLRVRRLSLRDVRYRSAVPAADTGAVAADSLAGDLVLSARDIRLGGSFGFRLDTLALGFSSAQTAGRVDLGASARLAGGRLGIGRLHLSSAASRVEASGTLGVGAGDSAVDVRFAASAAPLALRDLSPLLGAAPGSLEGDLIGTLSLEGTEPRTMSGALDLRLATGRVGGTRLDGAHAAATMEAGRADVRIAAMVEGARLAIEGWIRPLDPAPRYELDARLDRLPARIEGLPWWSDFAARTPLAAGLQVRGTGYARPALEMNGTAAGEAGELAFESRLDMTRDLTWKVERLTFEALDVARLAGDTLSSRWSGTLVAGGSGTAPADRRAAALLEIGPSRHGGTEIVSASVNVSIDGERLAGSGRVELDAGRVVLDTVTWRMDGRSSFSMRAGARGIDLARVAGRPDLASDLNADLDLKGEGLSALGDAGGARSALASGRFGARGDLKLLPSRLAGRTLHRGDVTLTLGKGELALKGALDTDAGALTANGTARPFDEAPAYRLSELRFGQVDAGAWLQAQGWSTDLTGTLAAEGRLPGGAGTPSSSARLRIDRSRVGHATIERAEVRGDLAGERARVTGAIDVGRARVTLDAEARTGDAGLSASGRAEVPLAVIASLLSADTLDASGGIGLEIDLEGPAGDLLRLTGTGRVTGSGAVEDIRLDSLAATARFGGGVLTLDTLDLRSNVVTAAARGRVLLADSVGGVPVAVPASDLHAEVVMRDPAPLAALIGADSLAAGAGRLTVDLTGSARRRTLAAKGSLPSLRWNDVRVARIEVRAGGLLDAGGRMRDASTSVRAEGITSGGLVFAAVQADLDYDDDRLRFDAMGTRNERHRFRVAGTAARDSGGHTAVFETVEVVSDTSHWMLVRPGRVRIGPHRLEVDDFEVRSHGGRLSARGVIDRRGDQDFSVEWHNVGADLVSTWLGREDLAGSLDGGFALEGPAAAARGQGTAFLRLAANGEPAGALRTSLFLDGSGLDLRGAFTAARGESLAVTGRLPLAFSLAAPESGRALPPLRVLEGGVAVRVRADGFPLRAIVPLIGAKDVDPQDGTLTVDARLEGTSTRLEGDGTLEIGNGRIDLPGLGVGYSDVRLAAAFEGNRLVIRECSARSGKGRIEARGSIRFVSLTRIEPDLTLLARRGVLSNRRDMRLVASGEVHFGGTLAAPELKGRASIEDSHYTLSQTAMTARPQQEITLTPEDLRMLEEHFSQVRTTAPDPVVALFEAMALELDLSLSRDNWIRQPSAPRLSVELTGEVEVRKPPYGELRLFGRLEPLAGRGYVEQFGRRFEFTGGEVLLNGELADHSVDIRTSYRARSSAPSSAESDVVIHLDISGTPEELRLTLSSEPALSETEIVTYIATGHGPSGTPNDPATARSDAAALARDIGLSEVSRAFEEAAQSRIGLDVLQLRFDALQGATLVAGRYIDPTLYVGFRQPLQYEDSGASAGSDLRTRFEIEYEAYRWLVLNLQGETSLIRSFIRVRHAY